MKYYSNSITKIKSIIIICLYFSATSMFGQTLTLPTEERIEEKKKEETEIKEKPVEQFLSLKAAFDGYFDIGVAVVPNSFKGESGELLKRHFNSVTPEKHAKMGSIHPEENRYDWKAMDEIVAAAQVNKMKVRGHTLSGLDQMNDWFFLDENGNQASKALVLKRLKEHIRTVVTRYKGKIYAWDVVNAVVSDNPDEFLRPSKWYEICGEDFIVEAFKYAHDADPNLKLFYNDYSAIRPQKRDKIYKLVKLLIDAGAPIHGIGIQGHVSIFEPSAKDLEAAIEKYAALELEVQITELDVSVYPIEHERRDRLPEDDMDEYTPEREAQQMKQYKMLFDVFREYREVLTSVTFRNVSDKNSWLDDFPVKGRKNYPLLFDQNLKAKSAFYSVIKF